MKQLPKISQHVVGGAIVVALFVPTVQANAYVIAPVNQLIVKFKPSVSGRAADVQQLVKSRVAGWAANSASALSYRRPSVANMHLLKLPTIMSVEEAQYYARFIAQQADVEYAEPDVLMQPALVPNDQYFAQFQWSLQAAERYPGSINTPSAWDVTTGSSNVTLAFLDSGIAMNHSEFVGRYLSSNTSIGIDMISDPVSALDGDGRDWQPQDDGYRVTNWHGTHVMGIAAATGNNRIGLAGVDWQAKLLPVRVIGANGGQLSDILEAIHWVVGDDKVPATVGDASGGYIPKNNSPANVINLSLGIQGECSSATQAAIDYALSKNASVVVAAGNDNVNLDIIPFSPSSCRGVINVAAITPDGLKASFSNYGSAIALAAPGTTEDATLGIASTIGPGTDYGNAEYSGTSMAAPHVTGVIGLMLSVNPTLSPSQVKTLLMNAARPHVDSTNAAVLGAGLLDACRAVKLTQGSSTASCGSGTSSTESNTSDSTTATVTHSNGGGGSWGAWWLLLLAVFKLRPRDQTTKRFSLIRFCHLHR